MHSQMIHRSLALLLFIALVAAIAPASPLRAADTAPFTLPVDTIGARGGEANSVAAIGSFAVVGTGVTLTILDASDPANPRFVAALPLPGHISALIVRDTIAYVAHGNGLSIVDLSNPAVPILLTTYALGASVLHVDSDGPRAYLGMGYSSTSSPEMRILDVSSPADPKLISQTHLSFQPNQIQVSGSRVYIADTFGVQIFDATNSTSPTQIGAYDLPGANKDITNMQVVGSLAYLTVFDWDGRFYGEGGLRIVDMYDPLNPAELGRYQLVGASAVRIAGDIAYLRGQEQIWTNHERLVALNIANPAWPYVIANYAYGNYHSYDIAVTGSSVLIAGGEGLQAFARAATFELTMGGAYREVYRGDAVFDGEFVYTAYGNTFQIADTLNPARPLRRGTLTFPDDWYISELQVHGTLAFARSQGTDSCCTLKIIDVSDPDHPALRASYDPHMAFIQVRVAGNLVYLAGYDGVSYTLRVVDVANPNSPGLRTWIDTPDGTADLQVDDSLLYMLVSSVSPPQLRIFSVSALDHPTLLSALNLDTQFSRLLVAQGVAYLSGGYQLATVDVRNPAHPTVLNTNTQVNGTVAQVVNNRAYMVADDRIVNMLDVGDPARPELIARLGIPGGVDSLHVDGDWITATGSSLQVAHIPRGGATVSANLSSVVAQPPTAWADGEATITVTTTLRDGSGNPIVGHKVLLYSSRGDDDISYQGDVTDAGGRISAIVRSYTAGPTAIGALDLVDYVRVTRAAAIEFIAPIIPPGDELGNEIDILDKHTRGQLGLLGSSVHDAGKLGDEFRGLIVEDTAKLAIDLIFGIIDAGSIAGDAQAELAGDLALPGVKSGGWAIISRVKERHAAAGKLFSADWQKALHANDWRGLMRATSESGLKYYAAEATKSKIEDIGSDTLANYLGDAAKSFDELSNAADRFSRADSQFQQELLSQHDDLVGGIPFMSIAQQQAYARDLHARRGVAMALITPFYRNVLFMRNLKDARASLEASAQEFFLKFGAGMLAEASSGPAGKLAVSAVTTGFDIYRDARRQALGQHGFALALGTLKGSAEVAAQIYQNTAQGYEQIRQQLPPHPVEGTIGEIHNYSQGSDNWASFWREHSSYSEIEITNTGDAPATFVVIARYGANIRAFTMPIAYIPLVKSVVKSIGAGETATITIPYKQDERGGSPDQNDRNYFSVLGANETGMFYIDSTSTLWNPTRKNLAGKAIVTTSAATEAVKTIENPIASYMLVNPSDQTYIAQIVITNPFTDTIGAAITQPLPIGARVVATSGSLDGASVRWTQSVAPNTTTSLTVTFQLDAAPGQALNLNPATMSFAEPGSGKNLETQSNSAGFTGLPPISVEGYAPLGRAGIGTTMPVTVTNLLASTTQGTITVKLAGAEGVVATSTQPFTVSGNGQSKLTFTLSGAIPPGLYALTMSAQVNGASWRLREDSYIMHGAQVLLPLLSR